MEFQFYKKIIILIVCFFVKVSLRYDYFTPTNINYSSHNFYDQNGNKAALKLMTYLNRNEELEIRLEASGLPRFAAKINPLIGFGRDLNHNGKIDTWFILSKNGIECLKKEGSNFDGTDVLNEILKNKYQTTFSMYASSVALSLLSYLSISANEGINVQEEFYQDWMDLEQLRFQSDQEMNLMLGSYTRNQEQFYSEIISMGYSDLANRMEHFGKKSFWGYAFADIGLWITGGIVLKWFAKILARIGMIAAENAFINAVKETFVGFFEKQKNLIESRIQSTKKKAGFELAKKEVTIALSLATYRQALKNTLRAQNLKFRMHKKLLTVINIPKLIAKGAKSEWKYIAINSSVQLGSEAYARYDEIYDPNPLVMAKNLLTNPDVIQNVGFMAAETIMMTGVSKNLKTIKGKFLASGAVALTNSSIMNFVIKDDADLTRVAFDTSWETVVGNSQVQLDLFALGYFEKLAQKKNNPKIKLIGYAVALIDMAAGYVTYSKMASALDKDKAETSDVKVTLIPIFAE